LIAGGWAIAAESGMLRAVDDVVRRLLVETEWSQVAHAYAPADDTFVHLANLISPDADQRVLAMEHLWTAVLHQGTIFSATAPAVRVIGALLADRRLVLSLPTVFHRPSTQTMRSALLSFIAAVATSARYGGSDDDLASIQVPADLQVRLTQIIAGDQDAGPTEHDDMLWEFVTAQSVADCRALAPELIIRRPVIRSGPGSA
jgi:hypothetical protein